MSRDTKFDGWWEGEVIYTCDNCHKSKVKFRFDDEHIDYKGQSAELRKKGWFLNEVNGRLMNFCCERCRNQYIRNNTI